MVLQKFLKLGKQTTDFYANLHFVTELPDDSSNGKIIIGSVIEEYGDFIVLKNHVTQ